MSSASTGRLRRPTLAAAPLLVLALMGAGFALWLVLWGLWNSSDLGAAFWFPMVVALVIASGAFALAKGCYVEVQQDLVRDVIGWIAVQKLDRPSIVTVRVRPGFWRVFEVELADGSARILLGASPTQFPARLLETAADQDLADIEMILGE